MNWIRRILRYISTSWGEEWLFFCLLFFPLVGSAIATYGLLQLTSGAAKDYNPYFIVIIKGGLAAFFVIAVISIFLLGISLFTEIKLPFNGKIREMAISIFFPITILLGKILHIPKEEIHESFLKVNNKLICTSTHNIPPQKILLLLPRCIQKSTCTIKLTPEGSNCQRCGGCEIRDLWEIVDRYQIKLVIATGSEVARKFIKEIIPEAVVAVACTKEMILGIQDTYPLLVLSVVNEWPNGPCTDTIANLGSVEEAIKFFLGNGQANLRKIK